jgi:hypothetical protein
MDHIFKSNERSVEKKNFAADICSKHAFLMELSQGLSHLPNHVSWIFRWTLRHGKIGLEVFIGYKGRFTLLRSIADVIKYAIWMRVSSALESIICILRLMLLTLMSSSDSELGRMDIIGELDGYPFRRRMTLVLPLPRTV